MLRTKLFTAGAFALALTGLASGAPAARLAIVPPGWKTEPVPGDRMVIRYVSPDGRAVLTLRDLPSARPASGILRRGDESVTYRQRGRSWSVVSGYRGDQIYYRRANLACAGARWHLIDLTYPGSEKRAMDATVTYISHHLDRYRDVCPRG
jgi:hypothetical protein